jgi:hypothetical protein
MFTDVNEFWLIQILHFGHDQGNERKVEPPARFIKMNYKGLFAVSVMQQDLERGQIQLDIFDLSLEVIFFIIFVHLLDFLSKNWMAWTIQRVYPVL